jgi:UDP-galactopyranose mutase
MMNKEWIGERVSVVDIKRVLGNVIFDRDDAGWGPNNTFKYPLYGGTGGLFDRMRPYVEDNLRLCAPVVKVDVVNKEVVLEDGTRERYDVLMSTMPMDKLVRMTNGATPDAVVEQAGRLRHSGSFIVGVGVNRPVESTKCWMYFPESDCPFYRVTYLSNYSPEVVPDHTRQHSLLAEISHSEFKPEDRDTIVDQTIEGMLNTRLLNEDDVPRIVDTYVIERDYTYPTPSLERDAALRTIHPWLHEQGIYSRGRFGAWRYEVGNMDHSVAQGVEWANRVVQGAVDDELTYLAKRGC